MALRVLSLGAGVQSTTLFLMALHNELPAYDHVIFSDTGWESDDVYQHVNQLKAMADKNGLPFHIVSNGNIRQDFLDGDIRYAALPFFIENENGGRGMGRRQCTSEYKIKPISQKHRELAGLKPRQRSKEHLLTSVIGISYDEVQRMRDPLYPWIRHEYPLIDLKMTRGDCIQWCLDHGYQKPPRSACLGCPYKSQNEWVELKRKPKEWADAVEFDKALRANPRIAARYRGQAFLHRSMKPLDEVDLRTDEEHGQLSLFDQECLGMCGN